MPYDIDPETINVDEMPTLWSPIQWELTEEERIEELEMQALASLLWNADVPETLLRLALNETEIKRAFEPPPGYNTDIQGEWDSELITFQFKRSIHPDKVERDSDYLYVEYKIEDLGYWAIEISPNKVNIFRI